MRDFYFQTGTIKASSSFALMGGTVVPMRMRFCVALVSYALLSLSTIGSAGAAVTDGREWATYVDPQWGYRVSYPAHLFGFPEPSPENGGIELSTADGRAHLLLFAGPNVSNSPPEELSAELAQLSEIHRVTYRRVTDRWLVLSGYLADGPAGRPGSIFYQRVAFSPDGQTLSGFRLEYPPSMRRSIDGLIGRIGRSLTPPTSFAGEVDTEPVLADEEPSLEGNAFSENLSESDDEIALSAARRAWCAAKYPSFEDGSGTFQRYDGERIPCDAPF